MTIYLIFSGCKLSDYFIYQERGKSPAGGSHCLTHLSLREKCRYSELFWSVIFHIPTEYGEIVRSFFRMRSEWGKIRTRITPNANTFYVVFGSTQFSAYIKWCDKYFRMLLIIIFDAFASPLLLRKFFLCWFDLNKKKHFLVLNAFLAMIRKILD